MVPWKCRHVACAVILKIISAYFIVVVSVFAWRGYKLTWVWVDLGTSLTWFFCDSPPSPSPSPSDPAPLHVHVHDIIKAYMYLYINIVWIFYCLKFFFSAFDDFVAFCLQIDCCDVYIFVVSVQLLEEYRLVQYVVIACLWYANYSKNNAHHFFCFNYSTVQ